MTGIILSILASLYFDFGGSEYFVSGRNEAIKMLVGNGLLARFAVFRQRKVFVAALLESAIYINLEK